MSGKLWHKKYLLPLQSTLDSIGVNTGQCNLKISNITSFKCAVLFFLNNILIVGVSGVEKLRFREPTGIR